MDENEDVNDQQERSAVLGGRGRNEMGRRGDTECYSTKVYVNKLDVGYLVVHRTSPSLQTWIDGWRRVQRLLGATSLATALRLVYKFPKNELSILLSLGRLFVFILSLTYAFYGRITNTPPQVLNWLSLDKNGEYTCIPIHFSFPLLRSSTYGWNKLSLPGPLPSDALDPTVEFQASIRASEPYRREFARCRHHVGADKGS